MGVLEVLTIVFVVLKLVGVIAWSWWAVFIPMYVAIAVYALVIGTQIALYVKATNEMKANHSRRR